MVFILRPVSAKQLQYSAARREGSIIFLCDLGYVENDHTFGAQWSTANWKKIFDRKRVWSSWPQVASQNLSLFRQLFLTNGYTLTKSQCGKHDLVLCTASNLRVANEGATGETHCSQKISWSLWPELIEKLYNIYF